MIYLDHNATTPLASEVIEAMMPLLVEHFGNAASTSHAMGRFAADAVAAARSQVGKLINAVPDRIFWTSGATESNNLALLGLLRVPGTKRKHFVTQASEHPSVLDTCEEVKRLGGKVTVLGVDGEGRLDTEDVRAAIGDDTAVVSVMAANNETGVLQPVGEIGQVCRAAGCLLHVDAAQAAGKIPLDVDRMRIDLLSLSGHKLYGPKGVGAIYVRPGRPRIKIHPIIFGGGHESGTRSGTLNVPGIVGMGMACEIAAHRMSDDAARLGALRDRLEHSLTEALEGVSVNGAGALRLPHVSNIRFEGVEAESLLATLDEVAASTGSACSSTKVDASHVLTAIGLSEEYAFQSVRFSLGRGNTEDEITAAISKIILAVGRIRSLLP